MEEKTGKSKKVVESSGRTEETGEQGGRGAIIPLLIVLVCWLTYWLVTECS